MWTRLRAGLNSPAAPALLGALALAMSLPSLGFGLQTDDHLHMLSFAQDSSPLRMLQAPPATVAEMRQVGEFAWWSSPELAIRFFRPLASLTHWLEFEAWPDAVWAMHLTNAVIYALLVAVATATYRQLLGPSTIAPLAALMFAIDGEHAMSVGWISSRNTVLATLFALLALLLYARGRTQQRLGLQLASVASTALALLSAEFGLVVFAYLGAYALVLDSATPRARWLALAPHALVGAAWAAVYTTGGYGLRHSGWYRDPSEPLSLIGQGLADLPLWLSCLLGLNIAEFTVMLDGARSRLLGLLLLVPLLAWLLPALTGSRAARFFALCTVLAIAPLFTTFPQGRLLIAASFGGLGWVACAVAPPADPHSAWRRLGRRVLRALHLVLAPLTFMVMLGALVGIERAASALADKLPRERGSEAVIINLPFELLSQVAWQIRAESGAPPLASFHQLYAGDSPLRVERVDDRTLDITASRGWGRVAFDRLFSTRDDLPGLGSSRSLRNLRATVLDLTPDGRPARVRFAFPTPLESPHRTWLVWRGKRPAAFAPPAQGERLQLPAVSPLDMDALPE